MPEINNVQLSFERQNDSSAVSTTVAGDIVFSPSETGNYKLEIKLFAEDGPVDGEPIFPFPRSPIYTFSFPMGTPPLFLGTKSHKKIAASTGRTLQIEETRLISREILNEDPGYRPGGKYTPPIPFKDEIYATVAVSQFEVIGTSETQPIFL